MKISLRRYFAICTGLLFTFACSPANCTSVLTIRGSDTLLHLNQKWAAEFKKKNPDLSVQVAGGGSSIGITALEKGLTDLAASSRAMTTKEKEALENAGKKVVEIPVALDALGIFRNEKNPLEELSIGQLYSIFSGKITSWKDLGWSGIIIIYSRENVSGTYEFIKTHVLKGQEFSPDANFVRGTDAMVDAITKSTHGIGYGGIAYLPKHVRTFKIKPDENSPGIAPTEENVQSKTYPLTRYLYFYSTDEPTGLKKLFIDFVLSPEGQAIVEKAGYFPLKK